MEDGHEDSAWGNAVTDRVACTVSFMATNPILTVMSQWTSRVMGCRKMSEKAVFVTNDKWMRVPGGQLDKTDRKILRQCGKHVRVITMTEALDIMQKEEPAKFKQFHQDMNLKHGIVLTVPQLYELSERANETMQEYKHIANLITVDGAHLIRKWRVDEHLTWRSIARRFSGNNPNQILGMALCERAAVMCNENYYKEPWN